MLSPEVQHEAEAGTDVCVPQRCDAARKEADLDTGFLCPLSGGALGGTSLNCWGRT